MIGVEFIFLFILGLMWILFATISDIKTKEIPNWLNFSLIVFAIGFRFFYSLFALEDFSFLYQGILGLGIFFLLGEIFYYGRMFAGGDKKLMLALGAVLPIFPVFNQNLNIFLVFFLLFFLVGAIYGIFGSIFLSVKNFKVFKKGFKILFKENNRLLFVSVFFGIIFLILSFYINSFLYFALLIFIFPYFYFFIKSIDEFCMVREVPISKVTIGDWLYRDVRVGKKVVKATWDGISESDLKILKGKSKVKIRYGIVFAPVFLVSFVLLGIFLWKDLFEKIFFSLF
ncbi:hypothetical protein COU58_01805 [Candidatus Pacearchaeota archaeon CG10_big_fil_rev_8_21_14_0_10_32_42]|nr:MAG: hypothetical protein COU58_01805 [Candidatus Pacearchaeota archaeon CG10_big_fil_rev_8_21_14_0_10_32_42]